jgi:rRNA maturation RNase YbeY
MSKKASPYEREAKRVLKTLLPVASTNAELRRRAGYPPRTTEPALGLDVTFVTGAKMKSLNRQFRGKDHPTDVLSFPALEIFARQGHLGDLVICEPILERQAKEIGHPPSHELHVLLVHGLLHLLGYDHERSKQEATEMAKWEMRLLQMTGKAPTAERGLVARVGVRATRAKKSARPTQKKGVRRTTTVAKRKNRPVRARQDSVARSK